MKVLVQIKYEDDNVYTLGMVEMPDGTQYDLQPLYDRWDQRRILDSLDTDDDPIGEDAFVDFLCETHGWSRVDYDFDFAIVEG